MFAATETGVYVSLDDGDHWLSLKLNLPVTSIRDLAVHGDDLIIATHGRSFWVLDDITPLREMNDSVSAANVWFCKPGRAVRMKSDSFVGTPLPPDEPQAKNPVPGAYLDYFLREQANGPVVLDILDSQGKLVRHFSSADKQPAPPANVPVAPRWFPKPQTLSAESGMHRFVWDLRFGRSGSNLTADSDNDEEETWVGPLVLPGSYTAKLTVNGHTYAQPIHVTMDPRIRATASELQDQFRWGQLSFDKMIQAREGVMQIQALQQVLEKVQPNDAALVNQLKMAKEASERILNGGDLGRNQGLQSVSRSLTIVLGSVESQDRTPPSQVIELYREADTILQARLAEWNKFKRDSLPALNRQLQSAGQPAIQLSMLKKAAQESLSK